MKTELSCKEIGFIIAMIFLLGFSNANAQLKGGHILGAAGLQSGTQAPEKTISLYIPGYIYDACSLKNANGNETFANPDLTMFLTGIGVSYVGDFKILGANYGAGALVAFSSNTIQGYIIDSKNALAFTDLYIQPLQLGWHSKKADFIFSYQLYLPTGRFKAGAADNAGLGMWMNEFSAGATIYFNDKKTLHFSSLAAYEINSTKKNTDIKAGDILSFEGGFGKSFYLLDKQKMLPKAILNLGLIYYLQYKVSSDQIPVASEVLRPEKDQVAGLGAELNYFNIKGYNSIGLRWVSEFNAENRFQGNTYFLTLAHTFKLVNKQ